MPTKTCAAEKPDFQDLQEGVTAVAKLALEGFIDGQADSFRGAMEKDRTNLTQRVKHFNEKAFALVGNEVHPTEP